MISSIIALAFAKNEIPVTSGPERVGSGVDKFTIHYNRRDVDVYVVYPPGLTAINVNGDPLVVNLADTPIEGARVIPDNKLDVLLSRLGLNTASLKALARYKVYSIIPKGNPLKYTKMAIGDEKGVLSFMLPLMYPYLLYKVSYKRVKKGLFSRKIVNVSGGVIVDLPAFSYCYYNKKFACDWGLRDIPSDEDLPSLKRIEDYEGRIITPEGLARGLKVKIDESEKILTRLESLGFVSRKGIRAFYITRIYPPVTKGLDYLLNLSTRNPVPLEWSYFPFMCVRNLHVKIDGITGFLRKISSEVSGPRVMLYPYIVLGFVESGRRKIKVYDVVQKRFDDRVTDLIKTLKIDDCLYLLSKM